MQRPIIFLLLLLLLLPSSQLVAGNPPTSSCPVTATVHAQAPPDPGVDPLIGDWYMNADRSIWAMHQHLRAGVGDKMPWIRPAGAKLVITGRRLDGPTPPLKVSILGPYPTAFQPTGIEFPVAGCWELTGKASGKELRFVLEVPPKS